MGGGESEERLGWMKIEFLFVCRKIIATKERKVEGEVEKFLLSLRVSD